MGESGRLKVLFIPAWYPSEENPVTGIFVREHARAVSLYHDVTVVYAYVDPSLPPWKLCRASESMENGIRTVRIKYADVFAYLKKLLVKEQRRKGHSNGNSGRKGFNILARIFRIPRTVLLDLLYSGIIFAAFRKLLKEGFKPDVIHAHVYSAGVPAVLLGRRYNIPVIITEHFTGFRQGYLLVCGLEKAKARFAYSRAVLVCPVSKALEEDIKRLGLPGRFHVVPNVVDTTLFSPVERKAKNMRLRNEKCLLFVGRQIPRKGIPFLLQALAHLRDRRNDFVLDIVGDGPKRIEYEAMANQLGLADVVRFHGQLQTKQEVVEFMKQCDFFVLPSLFENFGVVLIEAMACGKPVIATNIGGPNEVVTDEVGCLVPPGDAEALARAVDYMLDHYSDYDPNKISGYVRDRFSHEAVGKELDHIYKAVI